MRELHAPTVGLMAQTNLNNIAKHEQTTEEVSLLLFPGSSFILPVFKIYTLGWPLLAGAERCFSMVLQFYTLKYLALAEERNTIDDLGLTSLNIRVAHVPPRR